MQPDNIDEILQVKLAYQQKIWRRNLDKNIINNTPSNIV